MRDVCIAEDRDVGDRRLPADEPVAPAQVRFKQLERLGADLEPALDRRPCGEPPKARPADPAHHPLLLEREPLQHQRPFESALREERRVLGEVPEDRADAA